MIFDFEGIIPRAIQTIFETVSKADPKEKEMQVCISYLELYNEDLIDLLVDAGPNEARPPIIIREDKGKIIWAGIKEVRVQSPGDVSRLLAEGSTRRQTASTDMNQVSSRSHAIFSVSLVQKRVGPNNSKSIIRSKCHFVDLAGSERLKRTGASGNRAKEGININAGLLALGNVISALGDASKKNTHVPYRDSKLTRLLQDSIGGNSYTMMIACVSPVKADVNETYNTLKYANRARNIKNNVKQDQEDISDPAALKAIIQELTEELENLRSGPSRASLTPSPAPGTPTTTAPMYYLIKRAQVLERDLMVIKKKYAILQSKFLGSQRPPSSLSKSDSPPRAFPDNASVAMSEISTTSDFHKIIEPVVEEYEHTLKAIEAELSQARESNQNLQSDLNDQLDKVALLDKNNAMLNDSNADLQNQLSDAMKDLQELIQLQEQISMLKADASQKDYKCSALEEENARLKEIHLQQDLAWEGKLQEMEKKLIESEAQRAELATKIEELDREVPENIESGDLEESFRVLQELETAAVQMEKKLSPRLKSQNLPHEADSDLTYSISGLKEELEAKNSQLTTLEAELLALDSFKESAVVEMTELRAHCDDLSKQLKKTQENEAQYKHQISDMEAGIETLNEKLREASSSLEARQVTVTDDSLNKVVELTADLEAMSSSYHGLQASASLLESTIQEQSAEIMSLKGQLETQSSELEDLIEIRSKLAQLQEEHQSTLSDIQAEKAQSNELKEKINDLTANVESLEESLKSARQEIQEQNDLLNLQVEKNKSLQADKIKFTELYQETQRRLCMSPPPSNMVALDEFAALKAQKENADMQLISLKKELASSQQMVEAMEKEMMNVEAQRDQAIGQSGKLAMLEQERAQLGERLASLQKEHDVVLERNSRYAHQAKLVSPVPKDDETGSQASGSRRSKSKFICI